MKGIYCILNKFNQKKYIGSAKSLKKREKDHFNSLKSNSHKNSHLQRAYDKYGETNFEFIILETLTNDNELLIREQWWIDNTNSDYNICRIAGSSLGLKRDETTKEKIRKANLGLKHPDWRNKIKSEAQGGNNHWTKKKSFSKEAKEKMSKTHKELYKNGYKHPGSIAVYQYSLDNIFIKEWENCYVAAKFYKCSETTIRNNFNNKTKQAKGFIWKRNKI